MGKRTLALPIQVKRALRHLGADIRDARRRRRLPMTVVAERALISRQTLHRLERGDPGVSIAIYATVLFVLGLGDRLGTVAHASNDDVGLALEAEQLPKRIRRTRAESGGTS